MSAVAAMPSTGFGSGSCDGYHVSTNGTSSPASSSNSAIGREVAPVDRAAGDQVDRVGARGRGHAAVGGALHPRHGAAEVEPQHELHPDRDAALRGSARRARRRAPRRGSASSRRPAARRRPCGSRSRARACPGGSGARSGAPHRRARAASGRATRRRAAPRSTPASRSAAGRASRSSRRARRAPPSACRRSARSPRSGAASGASLPGARDECRLVLPLGARDDTRGNVPAAPGVFPTMDALIVGSKDGLADALARSLQRRGMTALRALAADARDRDRASWLLDEAGRPPLVVVSSPRRSPSRTSCWRSRTRTSCSSPSSGPRSRAPERRGRARCCRATRPG